MPLVLFMLYFYMFLLHPLPTKKMVIKTLSIDFLYKTKISILDIFVMKQYIIIPILSRKSSKNDRKSL